MTYLVMENHASYTIVMDEAGDFQKVANLGYSIGETLTHVQTIRRSGALSKPIGIFLGAVAASLVLFVVGLLQFMSLNFATVTLKINPEVRIGVMRDDKVRELKGLDQEGMHLISGYSYKDKPLTIVIDELIDRAMAMGYLQEGGMLSLNLDSRDRDWLDEHNEALIRHLNEYMRDKMDVTINVGRVDGEGQQVIIPVGDARPPDTLDDITATDVDSDDPDYGPEPHTTLIPTPTQTPDPTPTPAPARPVVTPRPTPRPTSPPTYADSDDDDEWDDTDYDDDDWDDTDYD